MKNIHDSFFVMPQLGDEDDRDAIATYFTRYSIGGIVDRLKQLVE